jgi:hypothetical protein
MSIQRCRGRYGSAWSWDSDGSSDAGRLVAFRDDVTSRYGHVAAVLVASAAAACATLGARAADPSPSKDPRLSVIARSRVWEPTNVAAKDLKTGPSGPGAFPFRATVNCEWLDKKLSGLSPKFPCLINREDEVKVKFGGTNGEVYGEVLATRLLWALGFPADRMYPVNVICKGCPAEYLGIERPNDESRFDPAVIERKVDGTEWGKKGWSWQELDRVDGEKGGAPRAHRDALKLLAVFMQHSDSKSQQQRIVCASKATWPNAETCTDPMLMISDVGLTFGEATRGNTNDRSGVNLDAWKKTPVWKDAPGCIGNLPKSFTGTLSEPVISEGGRQFLADLLMKLSDQQLQDLFDVARVRLRLRSPGRVDSGFATSAEWVDIFKAKRQQIVDRRCA